MPRAKAAPLTRNPYLLIKEITDLHIRTNFQNLDTYYRRQNQLLDFGFLEIVETGAVEHKRVRHGLTRAPLDLIRTSVTGPGTITFYRSRFDSQFIDYSTTGAVRVRFFVGTYWNTEIGKNFDDVDLEEWSATASSGQDGEDGADGVDGDDGADGQDGADGAGGSGIEWFTGDSSAPASGLTDALFPTVQALQSYAFANSDEPQYLYTIVEVPSSYVAGSPIRIEDLVFFTSVTSGEFRLTTRSVLLRPGTTALDNALDVVDEVSLSSVPATAYQMKAATTFLITASDGTMNGTPVAAGDKIHVRVYRDIGGETPAAAADVFVFKKTGRLVFA